MNSSNTQIFNDMTAAQLSLNELFKLSGSARRLKANHCQGFGYLERVYNQVKNSPYSNGREFTDTNRTVLSAMVAAATMNTSMKMYSRRYGPPSCRGYSVPTFADYAPVGNMILLVAMDAMTLLLKNAEELKNKLWALRTSKACISSAISRPEEYLIMSYIQIAGAVCSPAMRNAAYNVLSGFKFVDPEKWLALPSPDTVSQVFKDKGAILSYFFKELDKAEHRKQVELVQGLPTYFVNDYFENNISLKTLCLLDQWPTEIPDTWKNTLTSDKVESLLVYLCEQTLGYNTRSRVYQQVSYITASSQLSSVLDNKGIFSVDDIQIIAVIRSM